VVIIDKKVYGNVTPDKASKILKEFEKSKGG
jgi:NADH:ubiquinone oxidoreductase subunit E